jgi:hypothetical protein
MARSLQNCTETKKGADSLFGEIRAYAFDRFPVADSIPSGNSPFYALAASIIVLACATYLSTPPHNPLILEGKCFFPGQKILVFELESVRISP